MTIGGAGCATEETGIGNSRKAADLSYEVRHQDVPQRPRIALLTPYTGGNLGDAAIQDALIANLRLRLPDVQFSGLTLNSDNFVERHGASAFPLSAWHGTFYRMCGGRLTDQRRDNATFERLAGEPGATSKSLKRLLKQAPVLGWCLRTARSFGRRARAELLHAARGYRFLRMQDLLIVSGGGQLDEEWGGPWGHPFALFKWVALARMARIPSAFASVGACKVSSIRSRFFLSGALRMAQYRSYRDRNSRNIASTLLRRARGDAIVPDMAFSLPPSQLPLPAGIRALARGRTVVAISPIAYAKPGSWPCPDAALHERYLRQMTRLMAQLLSRDYFLAVVCSSVGDDDLVIRELLGRLDREAGEKMPGQVHVPVIRTWKDLAACLRDVDFLVASRLHSAILGFLTQTPTVAISFDPKVDWVMEDLGQTDYLLHICDFAAEDVIQAVDRIQLHKSLAAAQIGSYQRNVLSASARQYDALAGLAKASQKHRN